MGMVTEYVVDNLPFDTNALAVDNPDGEDVFLQADTDIFQHYFFGVFGGKKVQIENGLSQLH